MLVPRVANVQGNNMTRIILWVPGQEPHSFPKSGKIKSDPKIKHTLVGNEALGRGLP